MQVPVVEALVNDRASSSTSSVRREMHREWFKLTSASDRQLLLEGPSNLLLRREPLAALSCLHASHRRVGCVNVMLRLCRTNHSPHERRGMHARDRFVVATDGTLITPSRRYDVDPSLDLPAV